MIIQRKFARRPREEYAAIRWLLVCIWIVLMPTLSRAGPSPPQSTGATIQWTSEDDEFELWYTLCSIGSFVTDNDIELGGTIGQMVSGSPEMSDSVSLAAGFWAPGVSFDETDVDPYDSTEVEVPTLSVADVPVAVFSLSSVYPNPSRGTTHVEWAVPRASRLRLSVHDVQGREVAVLADGPHGPGLHHLKWSMVRRGLSTGIYFLRLETPEGVFTRRVAMIR